MQARPVVVNHVLTPTFTTRLGAPLKSSRGGRGGTIASQQDKPQDDVGTKKSAQAKIAVPNDNQWSKSVEKKTMCFANEAESPRR